MKTKIFILICIIMYPIYLYNFIYYKGDIYQEKVFIDGKNVLVLLVNSKLPSKKMYEYNEYGISKPGIYTLYFTNDKKLIEYKESSFNILRDSLRFKMKKSLNHNLYKIAKAIFLNEKSSLDANIKNLFKDLSISHLLALSGLHIGIIYLCLDKILYFLNFRIKDSIIILILSIYLLLIGFIPSITRAYLMLSINLLANILFESISRKKAFLFAFLITFMVNPFSILDLSYILSYLVCFVLIFFENKNILIQNIYIQLATSPIIYIYLKKFYFFSFLINIIAIPLFTILFNLLIISVILPFSSIIMLTDIYYNSFLKLLLILNF